MELLIFVYAHGNSSMLSLECEGRLEAGLRKYREGSECSALSYRFILAAGVEARFTESPRLAEQMRDWLIKNGVPREDILLAGNRSVWSTRAETAAVIEKVLAEKLPKNIVIISSWWHIRRIRLLWRILLRKKSSRSDCWNLRFCGSRTSLRPTGAWRKHFLIEPLAILHNLFHLLKPS